MRLRDRVSSHLAAAIKRSPLERAPFDHLVVEHVFPADLYAELVAQLPDDSYYRELKHSDAMLPDGRSARLQFPLVAANVGRLPQSQRVFWDDVAEGLRAREVEAAYKSKFGPALHERTRKPVDRIRLRHYPTLFRDRGGYKISIHPDSPRKAITAQYYLPADESQLHLGTLFHEHNSDGSFREACAMRFAPNTGYAFAVTPRSYHSVKPMTGTDKPRNSLMVIVFYDRGPLIEGFKAARGQVRALYDRMVGRSGAEADEGRYE